MIVIYQIGRLDTNITNKIKFKLEDITYGEFLSSFALKKYIKNASLVLIYPISLPFNKNLCQEKSKLPRDFKKEIETIIKNPKRYFETPEEFFKKHPHTEEADSFILIHSIGDYENQKFEGNFYDIVFKIFLDMVKRYLEKPFKALFVDVSSGHNIYISALLEATKHFSVFSQLSNWYEKEKIPEVYLAFSEPIIGSSAQEYTIYWEPTKFIAFFSSPVKYNDISNYQLARDIARENRELKRKIQDFLENFSITFSSIKNNIPLSLYHFPHHKSEEIKNFIFEIISLIQKLLRTNWKVSSNISYKNFLNLLLSLSLYMGITEVLDKENIQEYNQENGLSLSEIKRKFTFKKNNLFRYFNLSNNFQYVGTEINNIEGKLKENESQEWQLLYKFISGRNRSLHKRNFFAHCGFEENITQIRKGKNDRIFIRWVKNKRRQIRKMLIEEI